MEKYFFKVTFDRGRFTTVLVKAENVIDAGETAMKFMADYREELGEIVEITRTDIQTVFG